MSVVNRGQGDPPRSGSMTTILQLLSHHLSLTCRGGGCEEADNIANLQTKAVFFFVFFSSTMRLFPKALGIKGEPILGGRCYVSLSVGQVEC